MNENKTKRLAIHLYGHMRTYKRTYKSFYKNIIEINEKDGWRIDIFLHTWDVFNPADLQVWHIKNNYYPTLTQKKLSNSDIDDIIKIYKPKKYMVEKDSSIPKGRYISVKKAMNLRVEYEKEQGIIYDYFLTTRPDLFFITPLRIDNYLNFCNTQSNLKNIGFPERINFCSCWYFRHPLNFPILDSRFPNESDLLWFSNYCSNTGFDPLTAFKESGNILNIFIKYRLNMDFMILRETSSEEDFLVLNNNSVIKKLNNTIQLKNQIIKEKEVFLNSKIRYFEQNAMILSFQVKYGTAVQRIQNHLSYKLGHAAVICSKSFFGCLMTPIILFSIMILYKYEKKIYYKKIKKDSSLVLPPLEQYPDYKEAIKYKGHFLYKLGQALIKANQTWYKGGYIKLWFEIKKLKRGKLWQ